MPMPVSTRVISLLLAASVTGALLGSIDLLAAGQVSAARLAWQHAQPSSQVAATPARGIDG